MRQARDFSAFHKREVNKDNFEKSLRKISSKKMRSLTLMS